MAISRLNFTGRQRLLRSEIELTVDEISTPPALRVGLDLSNHVLPPDAELHIEAHRGARWMHLPFGTVGSPGFSTGASARLTEFESAGGVTFRITAVSAAPRGKILLAASQIRASAPPGSEPLLPCTGSADLGEQPWRVILDRGGPCLEVNLRLGEWRDLAAKPYFAPLVLPAVLREIVTRAAADEEREDPETWQAKWVNLAEGLAGRLPDTGDTDELGEWVNSAVEAFCRRHRFASVLGEVLDQAEDS